MQQLYITCVTSFSINFTDVGIWVMYDMIFACYCNIRPAHATCFLALIYILVAFSTPFGFWTVLLTLCLPVCCTLFLCLNFHPYILQHFSENVITLVYIWLSQPGKLTLLANNVTAFYKMAKWYRIPSLCTLVCMQVPRFQILHCIVYVDGLNERNERKKLWHSSIFSLVLIYTHKSLLHRVGMWNCKKIDVYFHFQNSPL